MRLQWNHKGGRKIWLLWWEKKTLNANKAVTVIKVLGYLIQPLMKQVLPSLKLSGTFATRRHINQSPLWTWSRASATSTMGSKDGSSAKHKKKRITWQIFKTHDRITLLLTVSCSPSRCALADISKPWAKAWPWNEGWIDRNMRQDMIFVLV